MPIIDWDLVQGSQAWYSARQGIPTASEFDSIITPAKGELAAARKKYACRLVAERLLNWQADSLDKIKHVADGKENEPLAIAKLEMAYLDGLKTRKVGFVRTNDLRFGASPDRLLMAGDVIDVTIEAKCPTIPKQFEYLLLGHENAYRCQVQGQLRVCDADKAIFQAFNPRMPDYTVETGRDEAFIRKLSDCLEQFSDELEEMTERAKSLGMYQAFDELKAPLDVERGDGMRDWAVDMNAADSILKNHNWGG